MMSYPLSEMAQPLSSPQTAVPYTSMMSSPSLNIFHNSHCDSYKNKSKESMKKQKKSFRTAKFLFPVQINLATNCQYLPVRPQVYTTRIVNNSYNPISANNPSSSAFTHQNNHKPIKHAHKPDFQKLFAANESQCQYDTTNSNHPTKYDNNGTNDNNDDLLLKSTSVILENSTNDHNIDEKTNLNEENDMINPMLCNSYEIERICNIDVSNICFDIVKRGNFPSILMKDGIVQIIQ